MREAPRGWTVRSCPAGTPSTPQEPRGLLAVHNTDLSSTPAAERAPLAELTLVMDTRRLAAGDQRVAPACPAGGRPPAVPSSPPVARWTRRRGCLQSSRRAVARPSFRPTRRFPGRPGWSLAPGHSGERLPARRPVRPAGCPLGHPESNVRPDRRPVSRPSPRQIHRSPEWIIRRGASVRPVARLPALRSVRSAGCPADRVGDSPPAFPANGCPPAVPSNPPVAQQAFRRTVSGPADVRLPVRRPAESAGCPANP